MQQVTLVSGPPGCGKTAWTLQQLKAHQGHCAYLRLKGDQHEQRRQGDDNGIDPAWLRDQIPSLQCLNSASEQAGPAAGASLVMVEVQQFELPTGLGIDGYPHHVKAELERLELQPTKALHFGRDPELPTQDTLDFSRLEAWQRDLTGCVWDPDSLSSFWFELVNGAYGDVYRAKALMNLPDGRSFFCNWMVSQQGSQFLPLEAIASPHGRPSRTSALVVQGKSLNPEGIQSTINDCLLEDDVLEMQQQQLRQQQAIPQPA